MTTPRSAADEARDPTTSPDRLLELTRKHPQLQGLIVTNPSCPEVAKEWILATNPWAKGLYEQQQAPAPDDSENSEDPDDAPTQQHPAVPPAVPEPHAAGDDPQAPEPGPDPEADPDAVSAWGDLFDQPPAPAPPAEQSSSAEQPSSTEQSSPAVQSPSVHVTSDSGVVPLGPAAGPAPTDGPAPTAALPPVAATGPAPATAAPPAGAQEAEQPSGGRRWIWLTCGGCLILAIVLLVVALLAGSALLGGDDDDYQRPTSDPATEQAEETTPEETTAEEPEEDPVSPAPDGAAEMDALSSPTGNITCSLEGDAAGCSVADRDFSEAGLEDCSDGPYSIQVADGEAASACGQTFGAESAPPLEYGDSAASGDVACTSAFDGMTCWNIQTGKGFFVNRVTYETF